MQPKLKITGQKELFRALAKFGEEAESLVDRATKSAATRIADDAKNAAPRDLNLGEKWRETNIPQGINVAKEGRLFYTVNVQDVPIAAYFEFGTGAYIDIPPEWAHIAWEFYKNGKGTIKPKAFFYPAFTKGKVTYEAQLKALLENLTKKAL